MERKGGRKQEEGKGTTPQCLKCIDAHGWFKGKGKGGGEGQ